MKRISEAQVRELMECNTPGCICHTHRHNTHCPVHEDRNPSFAVRTSGDSVLVHCFAGCDKATVWDAVLKAGGGGGHATR